MEKYKNHCPRVTLSIAVYMYFSVPTLIEKSSINSFQEILNI